MVNDHYVLKPSQMSIGFQLCILALISISVFYSAELWVGLVVTVVAAVALYLFRAQAQVEHFQHLDQQHWSIQYKNNPKIQSVSLHKIIDHYFYLVFYFEEKKHSSLVIWKDQIDLAAWKRLRTHAKLQ